MNEEQSNFASTSKCELTRIPGRFSLLLCKLKNFRNTLQSILNVQKASFKNITLLVDNFHLPHVITSRITAHIEPNW